MDADQAYMAAFLISGDHLDAERARERVRKQLAVCRNCNTTDNVTWGPDPYQHDINDDDTPVWLCEQCREELAADI